jgi:hypothetical protein
MLSRLVGFHVAFPPAPAEVRDMKIMAILMAVTALGSVGNTRTQLTTVCVDRGVQTLVVGRAQRLAAGIFASANVEVLWRQMHNCPDEEGVIKMSFVWRSHSADRPGSLAYAYPFEGTHIVVFFDRVKDAGPADLLPNRLAYVMTHEITHILQGIARHSETGIMKPKWNSGDYYAMRTNRLAFTPADVYLIQRGLDTRR